MKTALSGHTKSRVLIKYMIRGVSMSMGEILPVCIICGKVPKKGIAGGIFIRRRFLCEDCENMLLTAANGSHDYLRAVMGLSSIAKSLTQIR